MKVLTVVGARPQFIKAAAVSRALAEASSDGQSGPVDEVIVHTGQHYDHNMSQAFFDELDIPAPRHQLDIHGGGHGRMTGRMLERLEEVLLGECPDWVLIYGDTNSTLAAALAAAKLRLPVAHVEAGLRSFNMDMPEEVNRIVADRLSTLLLCPTETAAANLAREGINAGVHVVGDVMYDVALASADLAGRNSQALERLGLAAGGYVLATVHRAENTDDAVRLCGIVEGLGRLAAELPVVLPLHPRTADVVARTGLRLPEGVLACAPLPFLDMVQLERHARVIATDSGGVQKEAYFYGVPCITMRDQTEWVETVELGWNILVGADPTRIHHAFTGIAAMARRARPPVYGDGHAARRVVDLLRHPRGH